jgi:general secretion pathway protein D
MVVYPNLKRLFLVSFRLLFALYFVVLPTLAANADSAKTYYSRGQAAEEKDDVIAAYRAYKAAFDLDPKEIKYRVSYERLRTSATAEYVKEGETFAQSDNAVGALAAFLKALDIDPGNDIAATGMRKLQKQLHQEDLSEEKFVTPTQKMAPPPTLNALSEEKFSLHMSEDCRNVYEAIGKAVGVNVLFDPDYNSKRIQIDLKDVTPLEALRIVGDVSNTFWKPVTHNTIFIAQDSRAKRTEFSQQAVQIFYLKNVTQQNDLNDVQTAIRNLLPNAKIYGVASENAIMMRGTPDELQLAQLVVSKLDQPKAEVLVDITVMEVSRDKLREIGLSPPTSFTVSSGSSQTLNQIGHTSSYSITIGNAAAEFLLTDSDTRVLQNPRLRAVDGQKATLKLGERLPVATGTYTVATGSTSASAETQFQYLDVGVNVEMTPSIHSDQDVTLKLSVEVSSESGTETIDDVDEPIISQEKADQVIRLKDGETTILAGLVKQSDARTVSGWPGVGEIPWMKYFFSTQKHEVTSDELIFMIVPHIVRAPASDGNTGPIDTGTENGVQIHEVSAPPTQPIAGPHP